MTKRMSDTELREITKHRTFTSMAQRRRWLVLREQIEQNRERADWLNGKINVRKLGKHSQD
jgi:hypothetical protein